MPLSIDDDIYNLTITASDVSGAGAPSSNQTYTFTNTGLFWQGASATEGVNSGTGLAGLTPRYFYYSSQWQLIQEDANNPETGTTQTADQYVWGMAYVNELVLRDSDSTGEGTGDLGISGSGLDQRLYVQQDANWNVTALVNTSGTVVERYTYDAYGNVTVLNPDGTIKGNGSISASGYEMVYLYQGGRQDVITGLYNFQERDYNPAAARWMEQDPIGTIADGLQGFPETDAELAALEKAYGETETRVGSETLSTNLQLLQYADGANTYQFLSSNPLDVTDPTGLDRYISNGVLLKGEFHVGVAVDLWQRDKKGNYQKIGVETCDFSVNWNSHLWLLGAAVWKGIVVPSRGLNLDDPITVPSTPEQDIAMINWLDRQVNNPPFYSGLFYNCRDWSDDAMRQGGVDWDIEWGDRL